MVSSSQSNVALIKTPAAPRATNESSDDDEDYEVKLRSKGSRVCFNTRSLDLLFIYLFISFWVIDTPTTAANDYTRNRILHVCDLFTLGFLTVHIICCMANQLLRRVLRSFTCAGFLDKHFVSFHESQGQFGFFVFFLLELEILIRWGARSFAMQMCFQWGEKAEREKSRWYIAILQHFSVVFPLEKKNCLRRRIRRSCLWSHVRSIGAE